MSIDFNEKNKQWKIVCGENKHLIGNESRSQFAFHFMFYRSDFFFSARFDEQEKKQLHSPFLFKFLFNTNNNNNKMNNTKLDDFGN